FYLRQAVIADMVVEILFHNSNVLGRYTLDAFAVMPNHIHLLVSPHVPLPQVTKALKSYTAKRANEMLGRTGNAFWQEESYDHLVRGAAEGERIRSYIEQNPVRAGLVHEASEYRWSSAGWATGRSPADQEVRPTRR
ncbi:MAG: transposase, partial [Acidobacteriaceae bacterium]|nr:transposase [Acidobacteriaceae bacterium]